MSGTDRKVFGGGKESFPFPDRHLYTGRQIYVEPLWNVLSGVPVESAWRGSQTTEGDVKTVLRAAGGYRAEPYYYKINQGRVVIFSQIHHQLVYIMVGHVLFRLQREGGLSKHFSGRISSKPKQLKCDSQQYITCSSQACLHCSDSHFTY